MFYFQWRVGVRPPTSPNLFGQRMDFQPVSFDATSGVVAAIRPTTQKVWNVDIRLAPTQSALPQEVQNAIAEDYGDDADVKGVVHQGFVYLVDDQSDSTSDLEATILHEAIGHVGVRRLYDTEINHELNRLFVAIGGAHGMNHIAKQRGLLNIEMHSTAQRHQ